MFTIIFVFIIIMAASAEEVVNTFSEKIAANVASTIIDTNLGQVNVDMPNANTSFIKTLTIIGPEAANIQTQNGVFSYTSALSPSTIYYSQITSEWAASNNNPYPFTQKSAYTFAGNNRISDVIVSPDGKYIFATNVPTVENAIVYIYLRNGDTLELLQTISIVLISGTKSLDSDYSNTWFLYGDGATGGVGQTYVFQRNIFTNLYEQTQILIGSGGVGNTNQGASVAISGDGQWIIIGGPGDNGGIGAAWIFNRASGSSTWSQLGAKLVGTGNVGNSAQGTSVAVNYDGTTFAVGGSADNANIGAVWIFVRSGTTITQQGAKIVGAGSVGSPREGQTVSLSSNGNILAFAGPGDNASRGAVWIYIRTAGVWAADGAKLVPSDITGSTNFGVSLVLSANGAKFSAGGNTKTVNGVLLVGAFWSYSRISGTWVQLYEGITPPNGISAVASIGQFLDTDANGGVLILGSLRTTGEKMWLYA